jgi:hypothetical protein
MMMMREDNKSVKHSKKIKNLKIPSTSSKQKEEKVIKKVKPKLKEKKKEKVLVVEN